MGEVGTVHIRVIMRSLNAMTYFQTLQVSATTISCGPKTQELCNNPSGTATSQ